jgi:citrate synthase
MVQPGEHRHAARRGSTSRSSTISTVDIRKLYGQTGVFTYDPGFTSTASCELDITYIDGDKGMLLYRGYPIEQLASMRLPRDLLPAALRRAADARRRRPSFDHPSPPHDGARADAVLPRLPPRRASDGGDVRRGRRAVGLLSRLHRHQRSEQREIASHPPDRQDADHRGDGLQVFVGQPFVYPRNDLGYAEQLPAHVLRGAGRGLQGQSGAGAALDRIFILHADHEQNASTSTVRLAGSSGANPFACIAAGIACLWGPAHGGANEAALKMLEEIGTVDRIPEFIKRAKDKNDSGFRLMGFGHRVYKNYDPRAKLMQKTCHEVLDELGLHDDPLLKVAMELEKIALRTSISSSEALPERRLLFGHHAEGDGLPDVACSPCCSRWRAPSAGSRSGRR